MHITDEMEDPAECHRLGALRSGNPQDIEVRLVGLQHVVWGWVNRLHGGWLSRWFVGEIDVMPRAMMECRVPANVIRPAGREHEEVELLFLRREVELRKSWRPFRRKMRVGLEQGDHARQGLRARLLQVCIRNGARHHMASLAPGERRGRCHEHEEYPEQQCTSSTIIFPGNTMTGLAFQKHGGTFLMVIGSMCSPARPDVLVFGHYAYGRGFLGRYPARHAPALDTHRAKHTTSPKAHTADVADSTLPRAAGFPVLTRPNWQKTGVPTHAEMPSHSRA